MKHSAEQRDEIKKIIMETITKELSYKIPKSKYEISKSIGIGTVLFDSLVEELAPNWLESIKLLKQKRGNHITSAKKTKPKKSADKKKPEPYGTEVWRDSTEVSNVLLRSLWDNTLDLSGGLKNNGASSP
jgi:hypothetical protein